MNKKVESMAEKVIIAKKSDKQSRRQDDYIFGCCQTFWIDSSWLGNDFFAFDNSVSNIFYSKNFGICFCWICLFEYKRKR